MSALANESSESDDAGAQEDDYRSLKLVDGSDQHANKANNIQNT